MERKINTHLRRWLGIPPSYTSIRLYIRSGQLQLPHSSLVKEFQVAECRTVMTFKDSGDIKVQETSIRTRSGRKWEASASLKRTEGDLGLIISYVHHA